MINYKKITNIKELVNSLESSEDGYINSHLVLKGGLRSSKHISYDGEYFYILNLIDDTEDKFNLEELKNSFINEAIEKRSFYIEE